MVQNESVTTVSTKEFRTNLVKMHTNDSSWSTFALDHGYVEKHVLLIGDWIYPEPGLQQSVLEHLSLELITWPRNVSRGWDFQRVEVVANRS